jgi:hypothetical protein
MTIYANQKTISKLAGTPNAGLIDGVDAIHSGIVKGLESFAYNRMIIEHAGFEPYDGGTYTGFRLKAPIKYVFDGKFHEHTAATPADVDLEIVATSSANPHATHDRYHWVVLDYNSGGTPHIELIEGAAAAVPLIPDFNKVTTNFDKFIPVALIHYAAASANDTASRNFQMYTLDKNDLSLTIADDGASAGTIVEAMSITSASGDVTFESKVSNQDIIFKVNDGGVSKTLMTLDSSTPQVTILSDGLSTALDIQSSSTGSGSGPDLALTRTGIADAGVTPDGEQLGIIVFRGEDDGGNTTEYSRMVCYVDDVTDTTEDGRLDIAVMTAGSTATKARFAATQNTFYQNTLISGSGLDVRKDTDADFIALYLRNQSDAADTTGKVSLQFDLEAVGGTTVDSGKIQVIKEVSFTSTTSTQDASMLFSTSLNGTMTEHMRLTSDGVKLANTKLGFFGTTPIVKRVTPPDAAGIHASLVAYGLIA